MKNKILLVFATVFLIFICISTCYGQTEEAIADSSSEADTLLTESISDTLPPPEPPSDVNAYEADNDDGTKAFIELLASPSEDVIQYEVWRKSVNTDDSVYIKTAYEDNRDSLRIRDYDVHLAKEKICQITDKSLKKLEKKMPAELIESLKELKSVKPKRANQFLKLVATKIGMEETVKYENLLLKHCSKTYKGKYIYMVRSITDDGRKSRFVKSQVVKPDNEWFNTGPGKIVVFFGVFIFMGSILWYVTHARRGKEFFIRPISGLNELDNAVGRATEMGKPILFVPGLSSIRDVATIAGLIILGDVAKKAAEYDTPLIVPIRDYIVYPIAQEIVKEAYMSAGRPDAFQEDSVFFLTTSQFAYVAGVAGIMSREQPATNFYMGMFWAESLILTEKGNMEGCIQIAGTDADTQLPFFITTCDYTLIGEELYAASAYISRQPRLLGTIKAQDLGKLLIVACLIIGTICETIGTDFFVSWFPVR